MTRWLFRAFDVVGGPALFQVFWRAVARLSRLTEPEIEAAASVLGPSAIEYDSVWVGEGRLLRLAFRLNRSRAFTTFHIINLPASGSHTRSRLDIVVHELVHVYQFEQVGSVYIYEALRAQRTEGYRYGGPSQLVADREQGRRFSDYNREQQGQISQDYYAKVVARGLSDGDPCAAPTSRSSTT